VLAESMSSLINRFAGEPSDGGKGIDVGCQAGALTDAMQEQTSFTWTGIDPTIAEPRSSAGGLELLPGFADRLPFEDGFFEVALFANVYEHVLPERREASLTEIRRVLAPGGYVVGQIPNPYFPIESHSRLPFMGWLPIRAQKVYWRLSPVPWEHDFFVVTMRQLRTSAEQLGYRTVYVRNFNYPPEVIPQALRGAWRMMERPMRRMPWAWQFVLQRNN
jgi:SAM-dependent methyltransferase